MKFLASLNAVDSFHIFKNQSSKNKQTRAAPPAISSGAPFPNGHTAVSVLTPFSNTVFPTQPTPQKTQSASQLQVVMGSAAFLVLKKFALSFPAHALHFLSGWLYLTVLGAGGHKVDVPQLFPKLTGQIGFLHHVP